MVLTLRADFLSQALSHRAFADASPDDVITYAALLTGPDRTKVIALIPFWIFDIFNIQTFFFGGTSLLIVVGVTLDTLQQVESHLLMRHYDGFMKSGRVRGRHM